MRLFPAAPRRGRVSEHIVGAGGDEYLNGRIIGRSRMVASQRRPLGRMPVPGLLQSTKLAKGGSLPRVGQYT